MCSQEKCEMCNFVYIKLLIKATEGKIDHLSVSISQKLNNTWDIVIIQYLINHFLKYNMIICALFKHLSYVI